MFDDFRQYVNWLNEQKLLNVARNIEETINYSETPEKWWLK